MPTALTPSEIARRIRLPEEDPNYVNDPNRALLAPLMVYGGALGPELAGALGSAGRLAPVAAEATPGITAAEMAIIRSKFPGRYINPTTGHPQSIAGAAGQMEPAMGAGADPFMAMSEQVANAPSAAGRYLTQPKPIVNPETGYQVRNIPGYPQYRADLPFGTPSTAFTSGQRLAQAGVGSAALGAGAGAIGGMRGQESANAAPGSADYLSQFNQSAPNTFTPEQQEMLRQVAINSIRERPEFSGLEQSAGAGRGTMPSEGLNDRAKYYAQQEETQQRAPARPAPMPPSKELQAQARAEQPSDSILSRIFSGKDYQSNNELVNKPTDGAPVNWGNSDSAADFFRASKALQQARPEMFQQGLDDSGHARGGTVGQQGKGASGNNAALHKALEIIHHMLMHR